MMKRVMTELNDMLVNKALLPMVSAIMGAVVFMAWLSFSNSSTLKVHAVELENRKETYDIHIKQSLDLSEQLVSLQRSQEMRLYTNEKKLALHDQSMTQINEKLADIKEAVER